MTDAIRFLLGDALREVSGLDPNLTVLRYLREVEGLTGTKEGCAEGDCGACTVLLVEPSLDEGRDEAGAPRLRHRAVNACIQALPTLAGKQLLTVEHLKGADGRLHPAQQAMVETHGSQCGFCTPGFVMSLAALHRDGGPTDRQEIDDALAGNLCRCTGYGPIVEAARTMMSLPMPEAMPEGAAADGSDVLARLEALRPAGTLAVEGEGRRYFAPRRLEDLAALLAEHPDATLLAGGTDVGLWITKQHRRLDPIVYLGEVEGLRALEVHDDRIEIGAAVTYEAAFAALAELAPDFGEVLRRLGSRQIRNVGTIGGNIANGSPIGDSPPPLIALGSELVLCAAEGAGLTRRRLALEDFFIDYGKQDRRPGEFVERVVVPRPDPAWSFRAYKVSKRFDQDITAVLGAFNLRIEGGRVAEARICYGGMAGTPKRALACEQALIGRSWDEAGLERGRAALAEDYRPMDDMRASAAYRMAVAQNLLTRAFVETTQPGVATRLAGAFAGEEPAHA